MPSRTPSATQSAMGRAPERVPEGAAVCFWERSGRSLERWHLELDLGELVGRFADLAQEGQPARVGVDFVEEVFRYDSAESPVVVCNRFVEPLERLVGITAEGV